MGLLCAEDVDVGDFFRHQFIPAIIGDFPQPFLSGFQDSAQPTLVVYEEPFFNSALAMVDLLENSGITEVSAVESNELSDFAKGNSNLIIIALSENPLISELNQVYKKLGFYAYFDQDQLVVLDAEGEIAENLGNECGLIQATQREHRGQESTLSVDSPTPNQWSVPGALMTNNLPAAQRQFQRPHQPVG